MPDERWVWFFTLGLAAQQGIIAVVRFAQGRPKWRPWQWWGMALLQAGLAQGTAFVAINGRTLVAPYTMLTGLFVLGSALAGFMIMDPCLSEPDSLSDRWWRQGLTAVLASVAGFVAMCA